MGSSPTASTNPSPKRQSLAPRASADGSGAFQLFDGTQVVACGILRGLGRTRPAAIANAVGYWVVGLPFGLWLAFSQELGVVGVWYGFLLGLGIVAVVLARKVWRGGLSSER